MGCQTVKESSQEWKGAGLILAIQITGVGSPAWAEGVRSPDEGLFHLRNHLAIAFDLAAVEGAVELGFDDGHEPRGETAPAVLPSDPPRAEWPAGRGLPQQVRQLQAGDIGSFLFTLSGWLEAAFMAGLCQPLIGRANRRTAESMISAGVERAGTGSSDGGGVGLLEGVGAENLHELVARAEGR